MREKLIELIMKSVNGCARNWAKIIADYLLQNGVVVLPCKVGDVNDTIIPHNSIVAIWREIDDYGTSELLWTGMAWEIPSKYKGLKFKRIFGTVPETIVKADAINILADEG